MLLKSIFIVSVAVTADAFAIVRRDGNEWAAPTAADRRSPCPMVNTLANHGFLPRSGLNVSLADLVAGFTAAVNLDPAANVAHPLLAHPHISHTHKLGHHEVFINFITISLIRLLQL
ncbi:chloroperoxidase-like protein [Colletotrichum truncatum]|uniref:Chloroperoxidase-like protein n=1 Tax=Colletotrichum truncatum TaxID=5467 RepID=A0ACC3ZG80_COLTU|nr:chloroperoxidase-like protein [Colletotrichum truncatum]KAF6784635.1 chloroperoxidase-like protein [Colletotrichum truncatum]